MACLDDGTVLAFLEGTLADHSRDEVERHLESCNACSELATWAATEIASRRVEPGERRLPAPLSELPSGARLDRYQILARIGRGGMGEVYAAYHPDLDRRIALKVVGESAAGDDQRRTRLLREARAIARLSHPNVVAVYDAGTVGKRVYIAMELVDGATADVWLAASRRTWREIVDVFLAAGRGLAAAHAAEIVHRDFKPQNIMIGNDGSVRVMDFGLARLTTEGPDSIDAVAVAPDGDAVTTPTTVTKTGTLLGTPAYMAPEQFRGEHADARADQFSFCVSLHEALFGNRPALPHLPTAGDRGAEAGDPVAPVRQTTVPAWLRTAVARGLSPEREQRFSSMDELLRALERGRARPRRLGFAAAGTLAVASVVLAGWRLAHLRQFDCDPPASRLAAVWTSDGGAGSRRESIHRALLATGRDEAPGVWNRLSAALDDHLTLWRSMYREACEATHVRGEQSAEALDLRMSCLGENLDEVRALTDVLVTADARALGQVVGAARGLTPIERCADLEAFRAKVPMPRDERTRRAVEALSTAVNDVRALRDLGKVKLALEKAGPVRAEVEATRYPPLLAQLLEVMGMAAADLGDLTNAEVLLKDAIVAAERGRDDVTRVDAASTLLQIVGLQGRRSESKLWTDICYAILDRLGPGHTRSRAWVLQGQAVVFLQAGELDAARAAFEQSIALKEKVLGTDDADVAIGLSSLGTVLKDLGQLEAALAAEDRAIAIWNAQGSAWVGRGLDNRAEILTALHRHDEARKAYWSAIDQLARNYGSDSVLVADPLTGLGENELRAGSPAAAVPLFERALRLREGREADTVHLAETRFGLARALSETGKDGERSLMLARSARDGFDASHNARAVREVEAWLASRVGGPPRAPRR